MKVSVVVGGTFHAFQLAAQLERHDVLEKLVTTHNPFRGEVIPRDRIRANLIFEALARSGIPRANYYKAMMFDKWALWDYGAPDLLVGWAGFCKDTFWKAHSDGIPCILERSSAHVLAQQEILNESFDPSVVSRALEEYESADYICVPSTFAAQTFFDRGFTSQKVRVVPLGVDTDMFTPDWHRPDSFHYVLAVGAGNRKGSDYLIKAAQNMKWNVGIATHTPFHKMPELYQTTDVFVLPSLEEGFSLALLEAMASGLPCVATINSAAPDLIQDKVNGRLIPPGNVEAIREAVEDCFEHRRTYGRAARQTALNYTWNQYGNRVVHLYEQLLEEYQKGVYA